jgi:hypothetical protein
MFGQIRLEYCCPQKIQSIGIAYGMYSQRSHCLIYELRLIIAAFVPALECQPMKFVAFLAALAILAFGNPALAEIRSLLKCSPSQRIEVNSAFAYVFQDSDGLKVLNGVASIEEELTDPSLQQIATGPAMHAWILGETVRWNEEGTPADDQWGDHFLGLKTDFNDYGEIFVSIGSMAGTSNAYPYCVQFRVIQ